MASTEKNSLSVQFMFSTIAGRYDFLNHLLSFGLDISWRKEAVKELHLSGSGRYLDIATGTGDVALEIVDQGGSGLHVTGVDFSYNMLAVGKQKVKQKKQGDSIDLRFADALHLPFPDESFDGAICAFGIRNLDNLKQGLSEMYRVVKPGGRAVVLEFTTPGPGVFLKLYKFYFTKILPFIGGLVSGRPEAYKYLPSSVMSFPAAEEFDEILREIGFREIAQKKLTFGISVVHSGTK